MTDEKKLLAVFIEAADGDEPPYYCGRYKTGDGNESLAKGIGFQAIGLADSLFDGSAKEFNFRLTAKLMTQAEIDAIPEV